MMDKKIIIIEDNDTLREGIAESLNREGYVVSDFDNGPDAIEFFKKVNSNLAIIDLKMQPIDGLETLTKLKEISPDVESIMISAYGTVDSAVEAMKLGAADFLTKPFSNDELRIRVKNIFKTITDREKINDLIEQNRLLSDEVNAGYEEIVGKSGAMKKVFKMLDNIAGAESTIIIQGESGTGKELIARAIHRNSKRSENPMIKVNCAAMNDNLLESELFGHEKGAFTGAVNRRKGRFELADKGTIFLDEVADISPAMQVKLLRVLQEGEFERVGGEQTIKSDVRIISASNKDLQKEVSNGNFREDLFYRLSVVPITLPPLREREGDIILFVDHFLEKISKKSNIVKKIIDIDGIELLNSYSWPGNIRELENLIERLVVISDVEKIESDLIAQHLCKNTGRYTAYDNLGLEEAMYNFEKQLITQAMKKAEGVKNRAAKILGIKTSALYYKLEKFKLI
ncbi:MAG: sigma-54 dependent transcriptional regulator [Ignavibacteria bacterium]|jgi:DNA-binding NtrC family response regulator